MRARVAFGLAALVPAPLGAVACELVAGVRDTIYVGGTGGAAAPDAGVCFPPTSDAGVFRSPLALVPSGYGPYSSTLNPSTGEWCFNWDADIWEGGAPCQPFDSFVPMRGGLHASNESTTPVAQTVLVQCGSDAPILFPGINADPLVDAKNYAQGMHLLDCVFTVAPSKLPLFSSPPYGPLPDGGIPSVLGAFDFDPLHAPLDVGGFGQAASPAGSTACGVDRTGREGCWLGTPAECAAAGDACAPGSCDEDAGCPIAEGTPLGVGYTWGMPEGTEVLSVAHGIVRGSLERAIPGCDVPRQEIYVEYGMGRALGADLAYVESFVVGYLGLSRRDAAIGKVVMPGEAIGLSGSSGCQPQPALRFVVLRVSNLSSAGAYVFETESAGPYGFNGIQGAIDPFGWGAPQGFDPWGHAFLDAAAPPGSPCGYGGPGAFSIDLWVPDAAPPTAP